MRPFRYADGRTGEMLRMGFMPGKDKLNLYVRRQFPGADELMARLGKHTTGVSCTYVRKLADLDMAVFEELLQAGWSLPDEG